MSNATYAMAQYRYTGESCLGTAYNFTKVDVRRNGYTDCGLAMQSASGETMQFEKGKSYYVKISVKRDLLHDTVIDLKLSNSTSNVDASASDQYIDYVRIPRSESVQEDNIVDLAYYDAKRNSGEDYKDEQLRTCVVEEFPSDGKGVAPERLYRKTDGLGVKSYSLIPYGESSVADNWKKVYITKAVATWKAKTSIDTYEIFDITFTPVSNFNYLVLEIEREVALDSIVIDENGNLGRKITLDPNDCWGYQILDLAPTMRDKGGMSSITRIGVWGGHGLLLCVNGEPIKIGPSNYYEQDALPIETLGVAVGAADWENNFTIDYVGVQAPQSQY